MLKYFTFLCSFFAVLELWMLSFSLLRVQFLPAFNSGPNKLNAMCMTFMIKLMNNVYLIQLRGGKISFSIVEKNSFFYIFAKKNVNVKCHCCMSSCLLKKYEVFVTNWINTTKTKVKIIGVCNDTHNKNAVDYAITCEKKHFFIHMKLEWNYDWYSILNTVKRYTIYTDCMHINEQKRNLIIATKNVKYS